jgi:hypothetical protein
MSKTIQPYQTEMGEIHLNWMLEYQPQELLKKYKEGRLKEYLNEKVSQAEKIMEQMEQEGRS